LSVSEQTDDDQSNTRVLLFPLRSTADPHSRWTENMKPYSYAIAIVLMTPIFHYFGINWRKSVGISVAVLFAAAIIKWAVEKTGKGASDG